MNGGSYSSRGMDSTTTLPRIRKHEDTNRSSGADRHGSSRDHYVRFCCVSQHSVLANILKSLLGTTEEIVEIVGIVETATPTGAKDVARDHQVTMTRDALATKPIHTLRAVTTEHVSGRIGTLGETHAEMTEDGIGTELIVETVVIEA